MWKMFSIFPSFIRFTKIRLLNNLVRFYDNYEKQSVELALKITHMDQWMEETKIGLEDTIRPEDFTVNEAADFGMDGSINCKAPYFAGR